MLDVPAQGTLSEELSAVARVGVEAPQAAITEVIQLYEEGRLEEATRKSEDLVADYPSCQHALRMLGYCYHRAGRGVDAARMFERAFQESPRTELIKNFVYFRNQVALKIMDGVQPNGDGPIQTRRFDKG